MTPTDSPIMQTEFRLAKHLRKILHLDCEESKMEWISVKDRLPESDEEVLVYNPRDGINLGEFDSEEVRGYYEKDGSYFITNSGWDVQYEWAPHENPTHWMPLPQPPKD